MTTKQLESLANRLKLFTPTTLVFKARNNPVRYREYLETIIYEELRLIRNNLNPKSLTYLISLGIEFKEIING